MGNAKALISVYLIPAGGEVNYTPNPVTSRTTEAAYSMSLGVLSSRILRVAIIAATLTLQSCTQPAAKVSPPPPPPPKPEKVTKEVEILVSEDVPAYSDVAKALARKLGKRSHIRYLGANPVENMKMLSAVGSDENRQFVSIGLSASLAAKTLENRQVVFCQVFNYQDYNLLTPMHKGVSMVPSMHRIFATWKALAPRISDIGVISGPGLDDMMQMAKATAHKYGIRLHHRVVNSDKEYRYIYKEMADTVQGYWLIPDNRVLSGNILRDVLTFSVRNNKPAAVFSEELLDFGGLFSATSDPEDIAQEVLLRLDRAQDTEEVPGPDIVFLDKSVLRINAMMAHRLNLRVPPQYRTY